MAKTQRADELQEGEVIVLWAGPAVGEVEAEVTDVAPADPGHVLITVEEIDWATLRVQADEPVVLAD